MDFPKTYPRAASLPLTERRSNLSYLEQGCAQIEELIATGNEVYPLDEVAATSVFSKQVNMEGLFGLVQIPGLRPPRNLMQTIEVFYGKLERLEEKMFTCNWRQFSSSLREIASSWLEGEILREKISLWARVKGAVDCFRFVTYHLNEKDPRYLISCKPVQNPEVGDVAMYHRENRVVHVGLWIGNDEVVSKWGLPLNAYRHPTGEVFVKYGSSVSFVRKPYRSRLTPRIREELGKAYGVQFGCYYPYSTKGRAAQCREWIASVCERHVSKSHRHALFGQAFQKRYASRLNEALQRPNASVRDALAIAEATCVRL